MELNILTSQKGTKVVTATNLHLVLGLNNTHYAANIKKWLNDVYEFYDSIRKPIPLKDFAKRKAKQNTIISDYYISLEFAKNIVLRTNSKSKLKYALQLEALISKNQVTDLATKEEITDAIALAKLLTSPTYQEICERQHFKKYEARNGGSSVNWWRHRAQILGYDSDSLKQKATNLGKKINGKSQKQILKQIDKFELVRTATIDLFMALDKSDRYARKMGDLTKSIAQKINTLPNEGGEFTKGLEKSNGVHPLIHRLLNYDSYQSSNQKQLQRA